MKNLKRIMALGLALVMCMGLSVSAFAAETPTVTTGKMEYDEASGGSSQTIPVTISAEATVFDVDVPTAFPIVVDPTTGETTEGDPVITNHSYGSVVVSNITAKDNAAGETAATWHLAAFDKDMSKVEVDSNLIGLSVAPRNGKEGSATGTVLTTTDANSAIQVLLDERTEEWTMTGNTATDGSNSIHVVYDTNVSAVSETITNVTAANIVITIAWNTKTVTTTD